jgi:siroheme synthase
MHGATPSTPVTIVENASRQDQHIVSATLATLPAVLSESDITGPALLMYGLAPRDAATMALPQAQEMI